MPRHHFSLNIASKNRQGCSPRARLERTLDPAVGASSIPDAGHRSRWMSVRSRLHRPPALARPAESHYRLLIRIPLSIAHVREGVDRMAM